MGDSELEVLYLSPFVNNSGYQAIRRESCEQSIECPLLLGDLFFFGGGGDLFPFHDWHKKRITQSNSKVNINLRKISVVPWGGNEKSNVTQVTPKKALIGGVVRTGSQLPRSVEVVWKHTITFTLPTKTSLGYGFSRKRHERLRKL